jgi:hypothetical protein
MEYHIISASAAQSITGSIVKITKMYVPDAANNAGTFAATPTATILNSGSRGSGSLSAIDFGRYVEPDSSFTPTTTAATMVLHDYESFECPAMVPCIGRVKADTLGFYFYLIGPSVNTGGTIQSSY